MSNDRMYFVLSIPGGPRWMKFRDLGPKDLDRLAKHGLVLMNTGISAHLWAKRGVILNEGMPVIGEFQGYPESVVKWAETYDELERNEIADLVICYNVMKQDEIQQFEHPEYSYGRCAEYIEMMRARFPLLQTYLVTVPWPVPPNLRDVIIRPEICGWPVAELEKREDDIFRLKDLGHKFCGYFIDPDLVNGTPDDLERRTRWLHDQGAEFVMVQTGVTGFSQLVDETKRPKFGMVLDKLTAILKGGGWDV